MARELAAWLEARFELPPVAVPDLSSPEVRQEPELLAQVVREGWLLGQKPIPNMIHLLESKGVIVMSLAQDVRELDAFSFWADGRPIVLLNTLKSVERSRMDAAHELFHLVCHHESTDKREEAAANEFGGALLMPRYDLSIHVRGLLDRGKLLAAKHRWGVSLAALIYRLHEIKLLTEWQYRTFFADLSKRGDLKKEPHPLTKRETSSLLSQVFGSLDKRGTRPADVARELAWDRRHLEELIFGLGAALVPVAGGGTRADGQRAKLKLMPRGRA
jgi:Zn-dependent peptidase ImmA (M78 family)